MISKNIRSIGVEVECGIDDSDIDKFKTYLRKRDLLNRHFTFQDDGSVFVEDKDITDAEITFWHEDLRKFFRAMRFLYEKCDIEVNDSCGLHVHVKISDEKKIGLLTFEKFFNLFMKFYEDKYKNRDKYLERKTNNYCKAFFKKETAIRQLRANDKDESRYTAINLSALNLYETVEFRIFPHQTTFKEFVATINWFISTVERAIAKLEDNAEFEAEDVSLLRMKFNSSVVNKVSCESVQRAKRSRLKKTYVIKKVTFKRRF